MAQLDRVLPRLDSRAVSEVVLEAGAPIRCVSRAGAQPVTQQPLTRQQILALVAEVADAVDRPAIMGGTDIHVRYDFGGRAYVLTQDAGAESLRVVIRLADDARTIWIDTPSAPDGSAMHGATPANGVPTSSESAAHDAGAPASAEHGAARANSSRETTAATVTTQSATVALDASAAASSAPATAPVAPPSVDRVSTAPAAIEQEATQRLSAERAHRDVASIAADANANANEDTDAADGPPTSGAHPAVTAEGFEVPRVNWRLRASDRALGPFTTELDAKAEMERLLRSQVERKAADLHLRIGEPPIMRAGGDLVRMDGEAVLDEARLMAMLLAIMPDKNRDEFDAHWDTDFAHEIKGLSRFRVNALKDRNGAAAVMRTIASETVTVEQMGISAEVQQLCHLTKGLVLVTGPTGSGKSTTLCALVDLVNRTRKDHIITIEDPIEFVHQSKQCLITQRQVGVHTRSFKSALRAALREDPDIIMVGELRDLETIAIALETAETGHLVFGTLHTSTAASTINRIVDQFPADRQDQIKVMLAESLKGVISQTLCKKIGGGRTAAREILLVNKAVSSLIRESKTVQINNIIQTQRKLGMETLNDALLNLVKTKLVEPQEAYVKSVEKKDMALKLRALGHDMSAYTNEE